VNKERHKSVFRIVNAVVDKDMKKKQNYYGDKTHR
jgi:hypothetical protein